MEQAIDKGERLWRPVDPMRHHREKGWDYRGRAIYHFTLPVEGRYPLFGTLEGDSAETAAVRLNAYGRRVCQMLSGLAQFYKGKGYALKVLAQMVMPDHVHLVIQVLEPLPQSIGAVVRGFKSACTKVYKEEFYGSGENAAEVHGGARDNAEVHGGEDGKARGDEGGAPVHFVRIFADRGSVWQQDPAYYHERILHAPGQLRRMIDYVKDNPRRLWLKTHNPDLFKLHRRTVAAGLSFTSMGNHFLLNWPDGQTVEMSRSANSEQIQERLQTVLAAAHNGAITYTAAISKGEQLIARSLRQQGYPLVVLLNDGFPKEGSPHERYYKPGGVYFEACSKGQLLLLEPTEEAFMDASIQEAVEAALRRKAEERHYSYTPIPVTSQRYRFMALNEMARRLANR
ncbi:MAG: hypothetical protein IJQ59_04210 [Bacteroidaceae bacterium]|nr:hypothetical protein [Bacteroidaceae bacterium]